MTAICASWSRDGSFSGDAALTRMQPTLAPYGVDRRARWSDGPIALAISAGDTLPEDRFDREPELIDGVALVADIRLDNREALLARLGVPREHAAALSDSGLLRLAWRRWGTECVHQLVGEFAFVIWDRNEQRLFCARDPFGGRPLCYTEVGRTIAIASVPRSLLALPNVSSDLDELMLAMRLTWAREDPTRTFFRSVAALPPGHSLHVTPERVDVRAYWEFRPKEIRYRRDDEYVEHFREFFDEAVRSQLRSIGPVASTLSGGLDSSAVTAVAARELAARNERLVALTWRPKYGAVIPSEPRRVTDEGPAAAALVAHHTNIDHLFVEGADRSPFEPLDALGELANEPAFNTTNSPLTWAMGEPLRAMGCRALLTGAYGNFTISHGGESRISTLARTGRFIRAGSEMLTLAKMPGQSLRTAASLAVRPFVPPFAYRWADRARGRGASDLSAVSAIDAAFAARTGVDRGTDEGGYGRPARAPTGRWTWRMPGSRHRHGALNRKATQACLGFEFRDPTRDIRVLEYCLSIPEEQFYDRGQSRRLVRRAMRGLVPDATLDNWQRGAQAADWPRLLMPYRDDFVARLGALTRSPMARMVLDLPAIEHLLTDWPTEWTGGQRGLYCSKLLCALDIGGFILRHESIYQPGV